MNLRIDQDKWSNRETVKQTTRQMEKERMHKQTRKTNAETDKRAIKEKKLLALVQRDSDKLEMLRFLISKKTEIFSGQKSIRSPIYYIREKVQQIN